MQEFVVTEKNATMKKKVEGKMTDVPVKVGFKFGLAKNEKMPGCLVGKCRPVEVETDDTEEDEEDAKKSDKTSAKA